MISPDAPLFHHKDKQVFNGMMLNAFDEESIRTNMTWKNMEANNPIFHSVYHSLALEHCGYLSSSYVKAIPRLCATSASASMSSMSLPYPLQPL